MTPLPRGHAFSPVADIPKDSFPLYKGIPVRTGVHTGAARIHTRSSQRERLSFLTSAFAGYTVLFRPSRKFLTKAPFASRRPQASNDKRSWPGCAVCARPRFLDQHRCYQRSILSMQCAVYCRVCLEIRNIRLLPALVLLLSHVTFTRNDVPLVGVLTLLASLAGCW